MTRGIRPKRTLKPYSYFAQDKVREPAVVTETTTVVEDDRTVWPWVALLVVVLLSFVVVYLLLADRGTEAAGTPSTPAPVAPTVVVQPAQPPVVVQPAQPPVVVAPPAQPPPPSVQAPQSPS